MGCNCGGNKDTAQYEVTYAIADTNGTTYTRTQTVTGEMAAKVLVAQKGGKATYRKI